MTIKKTLLLVALLCAHAHTELARADEPPLALGEEISTPPSGQSSGTLESVLLYIPNRVFDLFDVFRLRARVGPGVALGVRATSALDVYLGSYISIFAGLPGPRNSPTIPLPLGFESHNGAELSFIDATANVGMSPDYSPTEFGLGLQVAIVGVDVGVDPLEILDFILGFFTLDIQGDDL